MKKTIKNVMCRVCLCLMITGYSGQAAALVPLPTIDFVRISETLSLIGHTITSAMHIKQQVELGIKTAQNEGFGAAAGMLFANIENGSLGGFLSNINNSREAWLEEALERKYRRETERRCTQEALEAKQEIEEDLIAECPAENREQFEKCATAAQSGIEAAAKKSHDECIKEVNKEKAEALAKLRANTKMQNMKLIAGEKYIPESGKVKFSNVYSWIQGGNVSGIIGSAMSGDAVDIIGAVGLSGANTYSGISGYESDAGIISGVTGVVQGGVGMFTGEGDTGSKIGNLLNQIDNVKSSKYDNTGGGTTATGSSGTTGGSTTATGSSGTTGGGTTATGSSNTTGGGTTNTGAATTTGVTGNTGTTSTGN